MSNNSIGLVVIQHPSFPSIDFTRLGTTAVGGGSVLSSRLRRCPVTPVNSISPLFFVRSSLSSGWPGSACFSCLSEIPYLLSSVHQIHCSWPLWQGLRLVAQAASGGCLGTRGYASSFEPESGHRTARPGNSRSRQRLCDRCPTCMFPCP
jgi:hypothetical protein